MLHGTGEGFNPFGKHTCNSKHILLITHTKWQLNEVQLQMFKGPERGGLRPLGTKIVFLKCTVGVRHAKRDKWQLPGSWEEPSGHLRFLIA